MRYKSVRPSLTRPVSARIAAGCATVLVLVWGGATGSLLAQEGNAPAPLPKNGLQVRAVSAYAVYYSNFVPNNGGGYQAGSTNLPSDMGGGGSIAFDWTKFTERSTFSLNYTPSYAGYWRNSSLNAFNHALSLNTSRKLTPRWTLGFSASGDLSSREQSLFLPNTLSNVASAPANFDDLAAALLSAKFTNNPQLGAILSSSPLVESPVRNLLYGQRMLTSSAHVSLSYLYSPRLTVTFSGDGGRTQHVSDNQAISTSNAYLIANTTTGNAGAAVSYSLSPLTELGGSVTTNRASSSIHDSYTTTSLATLGRTLGGRWLVQLRGGVAVINTLSRTSFAVPSQTGPVIGGSLGYKTFSHTFLGSYDRGLSDSYGLGTSTNCHASATWRWGRRGSSWWLDSSFNWQRLQGNALANTAGWHTTVGLNRAMGTHFVLVTQYVHMNYSGGLLAAAYHLSQDAMRVSMVWTPAPALR